MDFKSFWYGMKLEERIQFAEQIERSPGYLQLVAGGFRKASPQLANTIQEKTSGLVSRSAMRPDVFGEQRPEGRPQ